ncbi:hypothetical protein RFI_17138, partial [Reticulomyxa filosa]
IGSEVLMNEGEGALSQRFTAEKKSPRDFALWKASKGGEPAWDSPWGKGRPGWHIECSAMAAHVLGDTLDIHTGGQDLKFPHHDNEMAQSCAFFSNPKEKKFHQQWVNYWLHYIQMSHDNKQKKKAGHLHIHGLKMSKSLKNFVTIREALEMSTARQIRLLFVLQSWHGSMDYSDGCIDEAKQKEHELTEFFLLVNALNRQFNAPNVLAATNYTPNDADNAFNQKIMSRQIEVDEALRDNFDYPRAMKSLMELMGDCHAYLKKVSRPHVLLLNKVAEYINEMLKIFGITRKHDSHFLGNEQAAKEAFLRPVLDVVTQYRHEIVSLFRKKADPSKYEQVVKNFNQTIVQLDVEEKEHSTGPYHETYKELKQVLFNFHKRIQKLHAENLTSQVVQATDALRDEILPHVGVKLEDTEKHLGGSVWKLYDRTYLLNYMKEANEQQRVTEVKNKIEQDTKDLDAWLRKAQSPKDLFSSEEYTKKYSRFDEHGFPTHDINNQELSKSQIKKLRKVLHFFLVFYIHVPNTLKKAWSDQETAHKKYLEKTAQNPNFLDELKSELEKKQNQLKALLSR